MSRRHALAMDTRMSAADWSFLGRSSFFPRARPLLDFFGTTEPPNPPVLPRDPEDRGSFSRALTSGAPSLGPHRPHRSKSPRVNSRRDTPALPPAHAARLEAAGAAGGHVDPVARALQQPFIDCYYAFGAVALVPGAMKPDPTMAVDVMWEAMENLVYAGKVRTIGICNVTKAQLQAIVDSPKTRIRPVAVQIEHHPWVMDKEGKYAGLVDDFNKKIVDKSVAKAAAITEQGLFNDAMEDIAFKLSKDAESFDAFVNGDAKEACGLSKCEIHAACGFEIQARTEEYAAVKGGECKSVDFDESQYCQGEE